LVVVMVWATSGLAADAPAKEAAKKPEIEQPPPAGVVVTPRLTVNVLRGLGRARAGLYVKPFSGPTFDIGFADLRTEHGFDVFDLWANGLWGPRYDATASLWCPYLPLMLRGTWDRAAFYPDPLAPAPAVGARSRVGVESRLWPGGRWRLTGRYTQEHIRLPGLVREGVFDHVVSEGGGSLDLPLGPGLLTFRASNLVFRERLANRVGSSSQQLDFGYQVVPSQRWAVGAVGQWSLIHQPGLRSSELFAGGLTASYQPGRDIWTEGRLHYRSLRLGPTLNAYVRKNVGGSMRLAYQPIRPVRLRVGLEHSALERLNAIQSVVERPSETRLWARMDYSTGLNSLKGVIEYQHRMLSGLHGNAIPAATSANPLLVDRESRFDMRASGVFAKTGLAYGFWQYRDRLSRFRQASETVHNAGMGATGPVSRRLTLSGDLYVRSLGTNQTALRAMECDALVGHVGFSYVPTDRTRLWFDYYRNSTWRGEGTDEHIVGAGFEADFGRGRSLRLSYQHDGLDNYGLRALAFDADVFQMSFNMPF